MQDSQKKRVAFPIPRLISCELNWRMDKKVGFPGADSRESCTILSPGLTPYSSRKAFRLLTFDGGCSATNIRPPRSM